MTNMGQKLTLSEVTDSPDEGPSVTTYPALSEVTDQLADADQRFVDELLGISESELRALWGDR